MPYSLDTESNKENAHAPSVSIALNEQFIYRLASLEATLREGFKRLDDKFDALQKDTNSRRVELAKEFATHREENSEKFGAFEARLAIVEKWQSAMAVRFSLAAGAVVVIWTVFGGIIQQAVGVH